MATSSASLDRSPGKNWIEHVGGNLPPYIRKIARAIEKRGRPLSVAIPMAISRIKVWAAGGGNVTAKTQAKASAALAAWNALKAKAGTTVALSSVLEEVSDDLQSRIDLEWRQQPMGPLSTIIDYQDGEILVEYQGSALYAVPFAVVGESLRFDWPQPVDDVEDDEIGDFDQELGLDVIEQLLRENEAIELAAAEQ